MNKPVVNKSSFSLASLTNSSDEELMQLYQNNNEVALRTLVLRYQNSLFAFLRRHVFNAQLADDLFQEVFLRVVKHAHDFDPKQKFSTWLFVIARRLCIDEARRFKHRDHLSLAPKSDTAPDPLEAIADSTQNARQVELNVFAAKVEEALYKMPLEQREVFLFRHYEAMDFEQIAQIVVAPLGTVKSRMRYAIQFLISILGDQWGDL